MLTRFDNLLKRFDSRWTDKHMFRYWWWMNLLVGPGTRKRLYSKPKLYYVLLRFNHWLHKPEWKRITESRRLEQEVKERFGDE